jgi:hypothetical protein
MIFAPVIFGPSLRLGALAVASVQASGVARFSRDAQVIIRTPVLRVASDLGIDVRVEGCGVSLKIGVLNELNALIGS